ncbi:hypothetical protein BGZ58_004684, partial [Dissophora ornata]
MPDLTNVFRATVQDLSQASGSISGGRGPNPNALTKQPEAQDPWIREAHQVSRTMSDLRAFIITTRPAYLNLTRGGSNGSGTSLSSRLPRRSDSIPKGHSHGTTTSSKALNELLETMSSLTSLSDKDRDSIDMQAKVMMRQIKGAIEELESLEQERRKRHQKNKTLSNPAAALLSAANLSSLSANAVDNLTQHRQGVTLYLNERLASLATLHKDQYETRIAREMEKRESSLFKTLAKPGKPGVLNSTTLSSSSSSSSNNGMGPGGVLSQRRNESGIGTSPPSSYGSAATTGVSSAQYYHQQHQQPGGSGFVDEEQDFEKSLSAEQRQMLQMENENIVQKLETELKQVRQLESSMMELSSLHSTIQEHLEAQTLQTDRLHEEALTAINNIDAGNDQLIKAGKHNKTTRKWILFFLILA